MSAGRTPLPLANAPDWSSASLPSDGRRHAIQPADVHGRFQRARSLVYAALIALWAALPWLRVRGHPALFVDVDARALYLFGTTFNAQDTWLLFFLLTGIGFALVVATAVAGRVWCGWACPQTVFLEGVFRRVERWIEGPREERIRRNRGPWNAEKIARKVATHALYAIGAVIVAHIFLSYFASLPATLRMVRQRPSAHPEAFGWVLAMSAVFYLNFAWFREQLCVVLCPYGRLQSALLDKHSWVIGYDRRRGEPRGKKATAGAGDCVDCKRCVVVCPTGIDIRNGTQLECVACTACIDACDDIMGKLGRPRGLIRYDSEEGLAGRRRRLVRPRLVFYAALLVLGAVVALVAIRGRNDFEATLLRLPGEPFVVEGDEVREAVQLHLVNKRASEQRYRIDVEAEDAMRALVSIPTPRVSSLSDVRIPVFLSVSRHRFRSDLPFRIRISRDDGSGRPVVVSGMFLGPSG
ncbi:MAG: cytochrome c oxidase accessory protein CcoG [Polyangiaceae bacterium]|jgi:cytochrome c oxidase accessory protein FixG